MTWVRLAIACLVFVFTCAFRFNTLGGSLGGFDNDHFLHFAYAKQVQAGERPLRDFDDLALQGAWPSLTYVASAAGQTWLGDNLRSEAVVTVLGVSLAAALTFMAASLLSTPAWALPATLMSVFVAPTLYNYPKVLVLAASALVVVFYLRRPGWGAIGVGAVMTSLAFLFRHDHAAYATAGVLLSIVLGAGRRQMVRQAAGYAALTLLLLSPSLVYVQRHAGIAEYIADGIDLSRREARRTGLSAWPGFAFRSESGAWMSPRAFFDVEDNGVSWLYYLARALPLVVVLMVWKPDAGERRQPVRRAALAIAGMTAVSTPFLVRGNLAVRLGDLGPLTAVLLAVACHEAVRARDGGARRWRVLRGAALVPVLAGTAMSVWTVGVLHSQLRLGGLDDSWSAVRARTASVSDELAALPGAWLNDDGAAASGPVELARYLSRCTTAADRIVMMSYEPEVVPLAGRLFGAGRLSVIPGFGLDERRERSLVARWSRQRVPLALVEFSEFDDPTSQSVPLAREYLMANYTRAGAVSLGGDRTLRVYLHRRWTPVATFGRDRLPCLV
jgi:hypothetical protein